MGDYYKRCTQDCKPKEITPFKAADLDPPHVAEDELREEILKQLQLKNYLGMIARKWEKSDYRVRKDQMFQRFQQEKEEKKYQECICRAEQDKCKRERQLCQEENFAESMKELKNEEIRESAFRKQLHNCCPEIRDLERELRRAYYAKTLYAQRLEGEAKKLEEKMRQMEMHEMLMEKLQKADQEQQQKEIEDYQKKMDYNKSLTNQLQDATSKLAKKQNEFEQDKAMIDEIIRTIEKEELDDLMEKHNKIQLYRDEINHFLESREFHRERERARAREEDMKIKEFINTKEEQMDKFNKLKAERDAAKAGIVAKAIERIMQAQFQHEELEELRRTLYEEELAEQVRKREIEEREKRQRQMEELRAAEQEAKQLRAEKLQADKEEEEEYRKQLMAKFAEDERLEQLSNQKRRERECEHRRIVHRMINERRALKAQERERQLEARNCFDEETERRKQLIDQERLKLLKEHGPKLLGFIPRGVIKSQDELEKLGEPFLSYYRDQPKLQDPTTIDFEPCEEELFNNMPLPRGLKY